MTESYLRASYSHPQCGCVQTHAVQVEIPVRGQWPEHPPTWPEIQCKVCGCPYVSFAVVQYSPAPPPP